MSEPAEQTSTLPDSTMASVSEHPALSDLTLSEMFEQAARHGGELSIGSMDGSLETRPFSALHEEAAGIAGALIASGIAPGTRIAVWATSTLDFLVSCLSIWSAGAVVVPVPVAPLGRGSSDLTPLFRSTGTGIAIHYTGAAPYPKHVETLDLEALRAGSVARLADVSAADAALIQMTSGSTSSPRPVILAHRALTAQVELSNRGVTHFEPGRDRFFSWLPLYHDLGFVAYLIRPLALGISLDLIPTKRFLERPLSWLAGVSDRRATATAGPNFAFGLAARSLERADARSLDELDLSSLRHCSSGGEVLEERTIQRFIRAATPFGFDADAFTVGYGLAEATCIVSVGRGLEVDRISRQRLSEGLAEPSEAHSGVSAIVSSGRPLPGIEISIRDEIGEPVPDRTVGHVWVSGPTLMHGYVVEGRVDAAPVEDGWVHTGDAGYLAGGELFITGRIKDVVIIRGRNFYAEDVERVMQRVPGVRPGSSVAVARKRGGSEEIVLIGETRLSDEPERASCRRQISNEVRRETGVTPSEVILVPPGTVPKTTSGKLRRSEVREMLERGVLVDLATTGRSLG